MRRTDLTSATLALCAVLLTVMAVRREFAGTSAERVQSPQRAPSVVADWESFEKIGVSAGPDSAAVTIIEFADLECPACRQCALSARSVSQRYQPHVRIVFVHFPLSYHRFAYPAARAAECAQRQDRFFAFSNLIFDKQDSLGLKPWTSFASEAGITDLEDFERCNARPDSVERITRGLEAGNRLGIQGTPTVIINGLRYHDPPNLQQLQTIVKNLIDGTAP